MKKQPLAPVLHQELPAPGLIHAVVDGIQIQVANRSGSLFEKVDQLLAMITQRSFQEILVHASFVVVSLEISNFVFDFANFGSFANFGIKRRRISVNQ